MRHRGRLAAVGVGVDGLWKAGEDPDQRSRAERDRFALAEPAWVHALAGALLVGACFDRRAHERHAAARRELALPVRDERAAARPEAVFAAASPRELRRLAGVGEKLAWRLARARWERGAAALLDDLESVPGVGPLTAAAVRASLGVSAEREGAADSEGRDDGERAEGVGAVEPFDAEGDAKPTAPR